jgi:hypothetical protein
MSHTMRLKLLNKEVAAPPVALKTLPASVPFAEGHAGGDVGGLESGPAGAERQ